MSIRPALVNGTLSAEKSHPSKHGWRFVRLLAAAVSVAGVVLLFTLFPVTSWLVAVVEWIRAQGRVGWLFFAIAYVVAAVVLLPGSVLTVGGGFAYGPLWGLVLVSPVSVLAASTAFLLARTVARDWVVRRWYRGDHRTHRAHARARQTADELVAIAGYAASVWSGAIADSKKAQSSACMARASARPSSMS